MDKPQIYMACLAAYNNGILHGCWIDAEQSASDVMAEIQEMLDQSPIEGAEEYALHDYEGFGRLHLDEFESIDVIVSYAQFIGEHKELGKALLSEYDLLESSSMLNDQYHGAWDSEVDFAGHLLDEFYGSIIPEQLLRYIDYEAYARDLFISDFCSVEVDSVVHVFSTY